MNTDSPSKKRLIRISAIIAGILILIIGFMVVVTFAYGDKVKELVVNEINNRLLVPVEVGQVDFTLFRSFPDASVVFRNVAMKPSPDLSEAPGLLHAKSVSLRIGLFSLLTGNYKVRSLVIDKASVTLWIGNDGRDNFHVWKQTTSTSASAINFDMQQVILRKTEVYYRNLIKETDLALDFPDFRLKVKTVGRQFDVRISGGIEMKRLIHREFNYTPASMLGVKGDIRVNETLKKCEITDATLQFAGITAGIHGTFGYGGGENAVNLSLNTTNADISDVLNALPSKLSDPYNQYQPRGQLTLKADISGTWGKTSFPFIQVDFDLAKGSFTHLETGSRIRNINLRGNFSTTQGKKAEVLTINAFSGETRNGKFKGRVQITGFKKPLLDMSLNADLDLAELEGIIIAADAGNLKGKVVADINYRGAYLAGAEMAVAANGLVHLNGVGFSTKGSEVRVRDINGQLELKNRRVYVDELRAIIGETDLKLNGYFDNLPGYLLFKDQSLHFDARFSSRKFRLEDFINFSPSASDSGAQHSTFPKNLSFNTDFSIADFSYKKFTALEATGNLSLEDNVLRAGSLAFKALDGKVTASGLLNGRYGDHAQVVCNASLHNVDIPRLFYEFNDFGQTSLQSKHIRGRGDATVQYASALNNRFETDEGSVAAVADVEIRNGELLKFEPLQELSRFLDEEELRNVKFSTLRNRIEIARKTVVIPEMEIQTSALNLKGYGSHTFGNEIDYHFSLFTSELRKNKRRVPPPVTAVEDDGLGRTRLFLHMTGTVDKPVVNYDHRAVVKKIANDFKEEKQELRNVIKREFSKNKPATEEKKSKSTVQFEIEWDEDK